MNTLNVGIVQQQNGTNISENIDKLSESIALLAAKGAQLIVLQELHNSVYFCQSEDTTYFDLAEPIPGPSTKLFGLLAKKYNVVIVTSLFERRAPGLYHNTAVVIESDGTIAGMYRKMHIPDDPGYYEKFYFTPGDLDFQPINTSVGRLGVAVCWDQWYPECARIMSLRGAQLLIYPTAIGFDPTDNEQEQQRQQQAWMLVQRGHAIANGLPVIAVNRVGSEKSLTQPCTSINFWGGSFICGPQGEILAQLSNEKPESVVVKIDIDRSEQVRRWWPFLRDRRIDAYQTILSRYDDSAKL